MPFSDDQVMARGRSDDEVFHSPPSLARSAADWATSAIRGLARGTIGMAGQLGDIPQVITEKGYELGVPRPPEGGIQAFPGGSPFPTTEKLVEKIGGSGKDKNVAGKFLTGRPETKGGEYLESVTEMAAPSALGKGKAGVKALQAIGGGVGAQAAGDLAKKIMPDHETAMRVLGGLFGMGTPNAAARGVTPFPIKPERQAMVQALRKEGVEPTAGDVTGRKALKYAEHGLGDAPGSGGKYATTREKIGEQYTSAVLKRVGENASRATPEVVDRAFDRIGGNFDTLQAATSSRYDPQYMRDLFKAQDDYSHLFKDPLKKPLVEDVIEHAIEHLKTSPIMDGAQYKSLRSKIDRMRRSYKSDPEMSDFLGDVKKSMDDLVERHLPAGSDRLQQWQQTRRQYRNMLVVEKAATGAGEDAASGIISPAKLRQALVGQSRRGYARGQGDFANLARSGEAVLKPPPTSGTTERAWVHAIPAAIGAGLGGTLGGAPEALPGAVAGVMAPGLAGRALMSPSVQAYFGNQALPQTLSPSRMDALVRAAIAAKAHEQASSR